MEGSLPASLTQINNSCRNNPPLCFMEAQRKLCWSIFWVLSSPCPYGQWNWWMNHIFFSFTTQGYCSSAFLGLKQSTLLWSQQSKYLQLPKKYVIKIYERSQHHMQPHFVFIFHETASAARAMGKVGSKVLREASVDGIQAQVKAVCVCVGV